MRERGRIGIARGAEGKLFALVGDIGIKANKRQEFEPKKEPVHTWMGVKDIPSWTELENR